MISRFHLLALCLLAAPAHTWVAATAQATTPQPSSSTAQENDANPNARIAPAAPVVRRTPRPAQTTLPQTLPPEGTTEGQDTPKPKPLSLPSRRPATAAEMPAKDSAGSPKAARPATTAPGTTHSAATTGPANSPRSTSSISGSGTANPAAPNKIAPATSAANPAVPTGPLNRTAVVIDPARGGADGGSRIGDAILEKDVTLALAFKLRSLLNARGFTVTLTREDDAAVQPKSPDTPLTLNDRAGTANHARGAACLLLHATGSGTGVHLYSSELSAVPAETSPLPWLTAQAAWVPQSHRLERLLGEALSRADVPLVTSLASVRPLDSLTCAAVVVELAPSSENPASINDGRYQQRVAEAIAGTLVFWQNAVQAPPRLLPPPPTRPHPAATAATRPASPPASEQIP